MFVLDSSLALALLLPDEHSAAADALAGRLAEGSVPVPVIWPLEVRNALLSAFRQKRLSTAELDERLEVAGLLPVEVEPAPDPAALKRVVALAKRLELSVYDATYLDLARRRGLPLATFDARLRKACVALRLEAIP